MGHVLYMYVEQHLGVVVRAAPIGLCQPAASRFSFGHTSISVPCCPIHNQITTTIKMAYADDGVRAKLSALNETQDSIVSVAQWVMFHRSVFLCSSANTSARAKLAVYSIPKC